MSGIGNKRKANTLMLGPSRGVDQSVRTVLLLEKKIKHKYTTFSSGAGKIQNQKNKFEIIQYT